MIRSGLSLLVAIGVLGVSGCRERPIEPEDAPDIRTAELSVVHLLHQMDEEGNSDWSMLPATDAVVFQYSDETSTQILIDDAGVLALDEGLDSVNLSVHVPGVPPMFWLDVTVSAEYLVLTVRREQQLFSVEKESAQRFEGRVAGFSPSGLDETSRVEVYYRNSSGNVLSEALQRESDMIAIGSGFSLLGNSLDFWLPEGDNELVAIEKIVKESDATDVRFGRLLYADVFPAQGGGLALTDQTFTLSVGPDGSVCPPYGEMKMRWPDMDRSFIRRKTGGVHVAYSLQMAGGLEVPLIDHHYFDDRIRTGNTLTFLNPYRVEGNLAGAQYVYQSGATRVAEYGYDVLQFKQVSAGATPCSLLFDSSIQLPAWAGASVTASTQFGIPSAVTGEEEELLFWPTAASDVPVFSEYGSVKREEAFDGAPLVRVVRGESTLADDHPIVLEILALLQSSEQITIHRMITGEKSRLESWMRDPVSYVHTQGFAHTEVSKRANIWHQLLEWQPAQ